VVTTKSNNHPSLHLGLASIPYSLDNQIQKTVEKETQSWFDIEKAWTEEIGADVSVSLNSFKQSRRFDGHVADEAVDDDDDDDTNIAASLKRKKSRRTREICLVVRVSSRLSEEAANDLFETIKIAIAESPYLDAKPWYKANALKERQ
jgi:exopolyphosphatase